MPAYVLMSDMNARLPAAFLIQALDDDSDGAADPGVWDAVAAAVAQEIDGILGVRFAVPFANPIPAPVLTAAQTLAAEALYNRRGFQGEEKNPWTKLAAGARATLAKIAAGELPLGPDRARQAPSASIVSEPSKTTSRRGRTGV
jgi:phage gp36-like protein